MVTYVLLNKKQIALWKVIYSMKYLQYSLIMLFTVYINKVKILKYLNFFSSQRCLYYKGLDYQGSTVIKNVSKRNPNLPKVSLWGLSQSGK